MSRPFIFPYLAQFAANMSGRRMTAVSYLLVAAGLIALVILTVDPAYEAAHRWVEAALWACLVFFAFEWLARLVHAIRARRGLAYALSGGGSGQGLYIGSCTYGTNIQSNNYSTGIIPAAGDLTNARVGGGSS